MAAYPMMQAPLFADFKQRLINEYDCSYKVNQEVTNGDGDPVSIYYFERVIDGQVFTRTVDFADDDRVASWNIRSICTKLRIPPQDFGLVLG